MNDNNIVVLAFPSHTTHMMQPLDDVPFAQLNGMRQCASMLDQYVQRNYPRENFLKFSSLAGRRQLQSRTDRQVSDTLECGL